MIAHQITGQHKVGPSAAPAAFIVDQALRMEYRSECDQISVEIAHGHDAIRSRTYRPGQSVGRERSPTVRRLSDGKGHSASKGVEDVPQGAASDGLGCHGELLSDCTRASAG